MLVFDSDNSGGIYYQDTKVVGLEIHLIIKVFLEELNRYSLSNVLADESIYNVDLNYDSHVGGIISSIIADNQNFALYKIASGAYLQIIVAWILVTHR